MSMIISAIAAVTKNRVIGKDNQMPWHLPADLAYFKKITMGHTIIMGRKNYQSIGRPLPGRTNIIITRDKTFACSNCTVVHSVEEALLLAFKNQEKEVFIIGGGMIYENTKNLWSKLYITEIDVIMDGDVLFPVTDWSDWSLISEENYAADDKNLYDLSFKVYSRKAI